MEVNSSTYSNDSCPHPQLSSINSSLPFKLNCFTPQQGCLIFATITITITILLLLPLCILILYHGLQQWRQQHFSFTATTTHSDSFTYHLVTTELIKVFGCILCCCGIYMDNFQMLMVWSYLFSITWYGETFFQVVTVAVVHPIIYLSLRTERGVRMRNMIIACIWLLCFGLLRLMTLGNSYLIVNVCLLISSLIVISFCSLSVLCVLIHQGPGEQGRDRVRVDQSKQRAFYTILAILGVLLLRCVWNLVWAMQSVLSEWIDNCVLNISVFWINIPSHLLLPLLYLYRRGMIAWCKNNIK